MMDFYSTNNSDYRVGVEKAVRLGLPDDNGLFMPEDIPQLPEDFFYRLPSLNIAEIGYEVLHPFFSDALPANDLQQICREAFSFKVPLVNLSDKVHALELYHGPTMAFKDFGARFMARLLGYFNRSKNRKNTILVATSGDTGSAVANGFYGVEKVQVVILYPQGKVSDLQEKQMTTMGGNIHALAIEGSFDDCQYLVKKAFVDKSLSAAYGLTSANSINVARLLPQMLYYFYAWARLNEDQKPMVVSVPSGNYGNLTAGVMANKMGLPIAHFIAAANANNIVPHYLTTGNFKPKPSIETLSNAMDVGNPSNFYRLLALFNHSYPAFKKAITGYSYTDEQTRETIKQLYDKFNYVADPHGAIGYRALRDYLKTHNATGLFLETARPVKFRQAIEPIIGNEVPVPDALQEILTREKVYRTCSRDYKDFRKLLAEVVDS
jgi:threonine synthase